MMNGRESWKEAREKGRTEKEERQTEKKVEKREHYYKLGKQQTRMNYLP